MFLAVSVVILGLIALVYSADIFIDGAVQLATKFHVPKFLIGMIIIGIGTSVPEMVVSALSALADMPSLALGNAYGSNIANIGLVFAFTALANPIIINPSVIKRDYIYLLIITGLAVFQLLDGELTRLDGVILLLILTVLMTMQISNAQKLAQETAAKVSEDECMRLGKINTRKATLLMLSGMTVLVVSSRMIVWGAVKLAAFWGLSELVIGLTVVAVGTSLPELASSLASARRGEHEMVFGNIVGSNIFNTLAVVGISTVIHPFSVSQVVLKRDVIVMVGLTLTLFALSLYTLKGSRSLGRTTGAVLGSVFIVYTAYLVFSATGGY